MNVLRVEHITKTFGTRRVLDDVSFTLAAGECLGLVGISGGGKSTLARIIARLTDCDGGRIVLCGDDHATERDFYRNVQMIFQSPEDSFDPRRTLGTSIAEPIKNFIGGNVRSRVAELLTTVGLPTDYAQRYPRQCSGGECQRAAIARAISIAPKLLICDEATSALDAANTAAIVVLIKTLCTERDIACLFITHDLHLLPRLANRTLVLEDGRLKPLDESGFKDIIALDY